MKKRWLSAALVMAMAVSALAGCGSKPAETAAPATTAATEAATEAKAEETEAEAEETEAAEEVEYGPILQKAKETGKLVAAINAQSPPWRFH